MTRRFIYTEPFRRCWKAMGLSDDDLVYLERALLKNSQLGNVIEGTGGARKMRIQINGRGKSGGGRVIYLDIFEKKISTCCLHILKMCRRILLLNKRKQYIK